MNIGLESSYFSLRLGSLQAEMDKFDQLRKEDPEKSKLIFQTGMQMIHHCETGEFSKLRKLLQSTSSSDILIYYIILKYGYPLHNPSLPNILLEVLETADIDDNRAHAIITFMHEKGWDVNSQHRTTWQTPLHFTLGRNFPLASTALIALGADVNAVAQGDRMPLHLVDDIEDVSIRAQLTALLEKNGARRSWRRDIAPPNDNESISFGNTIFATGNFVESTQIPSQSSSNAAFATSYAAPVPAHVTVAGGNATQSGAIGTTSKPALVSFSSKSLFPSTVSLSEDVAADGATSVTRNVSSDSREKLMVRFNSASLVMSPLLDDSTQRHTSFEAANDDTTQRNEGVQAGVSLPTPFSEWSLATCSISDDGGLMFSTGDDS